ncbi:MAG: molybdopterin molybdenumtransferase MoeA [Lutibacter sp.]|nr:MAG: molybdopterin molybdenumtransferase MoeA [Lutibacter sp.]
MKLTTTHKALETILNQTVDFGIEEVSFADSLGRVLKEDILADRDFPPFNRISMDGIAVSYDAFKNGRRTFNIEGVQAAGSAQLTLKNPENCIEAMTGAMLPLNTDVVIPYEEIAIENGIATVTINETAYFKNIHKKGKDKLLGDLIIAKNTLISSAEIGVLATVGKATVKVAKNPKVMIVSTGDELVAVNKNPEDYQIRRSNVHTLVSLLERININSETAHITDDKKILKQKIKGFLDEYDVLLFSGAVSKGKFDFIPEVLDELGVEKHFHRVAQRPGKPFWFGRIATLGISEQDISDSKKNKLSIDKHTEDKYQKNTIVFAFPGNPISTFVSCLKYFYPWFQKSVGLNFTNQNYAVLADDVIFKPELVYFLHVRLENKKGTVYAHPILGNGSGDLASLVESDAFIELPAEVIEFKKGEVFPILKYRNE